MLDNFAKCAGTWSAHPKRRDDSARTGGFRFSDALHELEKEVPGLYEAGMRRSATRYLFQAPRKGTREAANFHGVTAAKVPRKRNDDGGPGQGEGTHAARAQQKLFKEFQMLVRQPCISGDDMNIIQVGRPAVSRYHQVRRLFGAESGPNYETHDFPLPELGIKLGGFMVQNPPILRRARSLSL